MTHEVPTGSIDQLHESLRSLGSQCERVIERTGGGSVTPSLSIDTEFRRNSPEERLIADLSGGSGRVYDIVLTGDEVHEFVDRGTGEKKATSTSKELKFADGEVIYAGVRPRNWQHAKRVREEQLGTFVTLLIEEVEEELTQHGLL